MTSIQVTLLIDGPPDDLKRAAESIGVKPTYVSPVVGQTPQKLMARWQHPAKDAPVEQANEMAMAQLSLLARLGEPAVRSSTLYVQLAIGMFDVKASGSIVFIEPEVIAELSRWKCRVVIDAYPE